MLRIPTVQYLPYLWLAYTDPILSLLWGYTGIAVWKFEKEHTESSKG